MLKLTNQERQAAKYALILYGILEACRKDPEVAKITADTVRNLSVTFPELEYSLEHVSVALKQFVLQEQGV